MEKINEVLNPKRRIVEDLKERNLGNEKTIAQEYFGSKFNYEKTFKMINDYKKAFIDLDGLNEDPIVISAPTTVSSVNALYGVMDADKIASMTGPGFLHAYTDKYTKEIGCKTVFILDMFLNESLIQKLHKSGVKNVIITKVTDYMHPLVKFIGKRKGLVQDKDFLDEYVKGGKKLPMDMQFIRLNEFAKQGSKIKEDIVLPYNDEKIATYFLTGATTSRVPKCVKIYADGWNKMANVYDKIGFDFQRGDRNVIFIPIFYATGAIHSVHAGFFSGATNIYKPKYDRHAFAADLVETKAHVTSVAPSHMATLETAGLEDNSLSHIKYLFLGGEAIMPSQMERFRKVGKRLGIQNVSNAYGMTETGSMSSISKANLSSDADVGLEPVYGMKYRISDPVTKEILPDNERGIIEVNSPCVSAGYLEEEKNKELFTEDGWVNTGDIGIRHSDGSYRVFGRYSDRFTNDGEVYYMFDIEEKVLDHPGIIEAEVIKQTINGEERPAIVVVLEKEWENRRGDVIKDLLTIDAPGMEHLIGVRVIDNFETNQVTAKRDILSLEEVKNGYYKYNNEENLFYQVDFENELVEYPISNEEVIISKKEDAKTLSLNK